MLRRIAGLSALVLAAAAPLSAQAFYYPALQPSRIAEREYNFVLADMDGGATGLIFQWREGLGNPKSQFTLDAGLVDADNVDTRLVIGGGFGYQLTTASTDMPFDIVLAGGLGLSTGNDITTIRIPFGASIGHRFPVEGGFAITPFVHPRIAFTNTNFPDPIDSDSDTDLEVDIGANFEFKPQMAFRLGATLGDFDAIAFSFAWTPKGLRSK